MDRVPHPAINSVAAIQTAAAGEISFETLPPQIQQDLKDAYAQYLAYGSSQIKNLNQQAPLNPFYKEEDVFLSSAAGNQATYTSTIRLSAYETTLHRA